MPRPWSRPGVRSSYRATRGCGRRRRSAPRRSRGASAGDRVLIVNENCAAAIVLALAANRCRAWPVLVNARLSAREIEAIRGHCVPRRTFCTVEVSPRRGGTRERGSAASRSRCPASATVAVAPSDEAAVPRPSRTIPRAASARWSTRPARPARRRASCSRTEPAVRRASPARRSGGSAPTIGCTWRCRSRTSSASPRCAEQRCSPARRCISSRASRPRGSPRARRRRRQRSLPGVPAMYARLLDHAHRTGQPHRRAAARFAVRGRRAARSRAQGRGGAASSTSRCTTATA